MQAQLQPGQKTPQEYMEKTTSTKTSNESLLAVLTKMSSDELTSMLTQCFKITDAELFSISGMQLVVVREFSRAASNSLSFSKPPTYDMVVKMVAKRLKLPAPSDSDVLEIERAILFKVLKMSLDKMSGDKKEDLVKRIEEELKSKGIYRKVAFAEIVDFLKFAGMDIGANVGGLAMSGPGLSGLVGMNFLQWMVVKAVLLTSGHFVAATAVLGLGTGGLMYTAAGAAGPIGMGAALLYTGYSAGGPAFRKLIPFVCMVASKRMEMASDNRGGQG